MNPNDRITYGIEDAYHQLGVSRSTLYQLIQSGELSSIKVGKRRLVSRHALEQFIARKEREQGRVAA